MVVNQTVANVIIKMFKGVGVAMIALNGVRKHYSALETCILQAVLATKIKNYQANDLVTKVD